MTPTYAIQPIVVVSPDGFTDYWGILHEPSDQLFTLSGGAVFVASDKACALSTVRFLNGLTEELPVCTCQD